MPAKHHTSRPAHVIQEAVRRYLVGGERVALLHKEYKISKAGFHLWINKEKAALLAKSLQAAMSPVSIEKAERRDLLLQVDAERAKNRKLKRQLCEWMIKTGDYSMLTQP